MLSKQQPLILAEIKRVRIIKKGEEILLRFTMSTGLKVEARIHQGLAVTMAHKIYKETGILPSAAAQESVANHYATYLGMRN